MRITLTKTDTIIIDSVSVFMILLKMFGLTQMSWLIVLSIVFVEIALLVAWKFNKVSIQRQHNKIVISR